jgi:hypothetical protein
MKRTTVSQRLTEAYWTGAMVTLYRTITPRYTYRGFVVALNDDFVLLHIFNGNVVLLDGYCLLHRSDVRRVVLVDRAHFLYQAAQQRHQTGVAPLDVIISDMAGLLSSAGAHYRFLSIYTKDGKQDEAFYIGCVDRFGEKCVYLHTVDDHGDWQRIRKMNYKDITRVDFADRYSEALWSVIEAQKKKQ